MSDEKLLKESYIAKPQKYTLPTDQLTDRTKKTHQAIYESAVENMNNISFKLEGAERAASNSKSSLYRHLKVDESSAINDSFLHALYFDNISDLKSQITTNMLCYSKLSKDFGSFDRWQEDFIATCMASRNGWGVTVFNYFINRYINVVVDEEAVNVPFGSIPVIVMDMHEHAYVHDYLGDKKTYIAAMMLEFDWDVINSRFERAEKVSIVLQPRLANNIMPEIK